MALAAAGGPEDTTGPDEMAVLRGYTKAPPKCFFLSNHGEEDAIYLFIAYFSSPCGFLTLKRAFSSLCRSRN